MFRFSSKKITFNYKILLLQTRNTSVKTRAALPPKPFAQDNYRKHIGPIGWLLLVIPTAACGLGTWQIQRKKWKEDLIAQLYARTHADPQPLPVDLEELKNLEYQPVTVRGHFDHSKEIYLGPRSLLVDGDAASTGGLMTQKNQFGTSGYLVVTPFKLSDRDLTILVNRGWVPVQKKDPRTRAEGQIQKELTITGVVRLNEPRPTFSIKNKPGANFLLYRDLNQMCELTGADPVFIEAISDCTIEGGPIGGQTRVTLRNEHLSYVMTWYSLAAATGFMWYRHFIRKRPVF